MNFGLVLEKLNEKGFSYSSLKEKKIEDHYIKPEEPEEDSDDFPF